MTNPLTMTTVGGIDIHKVAALVQQLAQARQELRTEQHNAETQAAEAARLRLTLAELQATKEEEEKEGKAASHASSSSSSSEQGTPHRATEEERGHTHRLRQCAVNEGKENDKAIVVKTPSKRDGKSTVHDHHSNRRSNRERTHSRRAERHTNSSKHADMKRSNEETIGVERWRQRYSDLLRRYRREKARRNEDLTSIHSLVEQICLEQDYAHLIHEHTRLLQQQQGKCMERTSGVQRGRLMAPALLHSECAANGLDSEYEDVSVQDIHRSEIRHAESQHITQPHYTSTSSTHVNSITRVMSRATPASAHAAMYSHSSTLTHKYAPAQSTCMPRGTSEKSVQTRQDSPLIQPGAQNVTSYDANGSPLQNSSVTRQSIETQTAPHFLASPAAATMPVASDGSLPLFFTSANATNTNNCCYSSTPYVMVDPTRVSQLTAATNTAETTTQLPPALPTAPLAYNNNPENYLHTSNGVVYGPQGMNGMPSLTTLQWYKKYMAHEEEDDDEAYDDGVEGNGRTARRAQLARDQARHAELLAAIRELQSTAAVCNATREENNENDV